MTEPTPATVLRADEGERLEGGNTVVAIKATAESTDGGLYLSETVLGPDATGPPPHTHATRTDMFYVLEGTLALLASGPPDPAAMADMLARHDVLVAG